VKFNNKVLFFILCIFALVFIAGGCSPSSSQPAAAEQVIRYNIGAEPATLDPALSTGMTEQTVANALLEGLVRLDKDGLPSPGVAESWETSPDCRTYTFNLRECYWSNGELLTADDFVYSWLRLLSPETASPYAYQLFYLVNGQEYNSGEVKDPASVGVRAEGKDRLVVTLKDPVPYFLSLTAFPALFPVPESAVSEDPDGWTLTPAGFTGNGPFKLASWEHNKQIVLEKNDRYWDRENVKLEKLVITLVADSNTELAMFENGQIDIAETPPYREMERLAESGELKVSPDLSNEYYMFNTKVKPFDQVLVRRALSLAIDRESLVTNLTKSGERAAYAFVPPGVEGPAPGQDFRSLGERLTGGFNPGEARKLLAEAGFPEGRGFPVIQLLLDDNQNHKAVAEAITGMWQEHLGIQSKIIEQEYRVYLSTMFAKDYQVARVGWIADYNDPMTFLDMWVTGNDNNLADWENAEYDRLIGAAAGEVDRAVRNGLMFEAERILMDQLPVVPVYYYTNPYLERDTVKGVIHPSFAIFAEFKWAYVE
jgi:oligopeptide transport system substrate-binding protein